MKNKYIFAALAVIALAAIIVLGRRATGPAVSPTESPTASPSASPAQTLLPRIDSFAPMSGPVGTAVTVLGNNFEGTTSVTIGNVAAPVTAKSGTSLTVVVPAGAVSGRVRVTNAAGTAVSANAFTVVAATASPSPTPSSSPTPSPTPSATAVLGFSAAAYSGDEDGGPVTITVTRTVNLASVVSVRYDISDGSADANDYIHTSGMLTFAAGVGVQTFSVRLYDDQLAESDETVALRLFGASPGATLGISAATLTIVDDETQTL